MPKHGETIDPKIWGNWPEVITSFTSLPKLGWGFDLFVDIFRIQPLDGILILGAQVNLHTRLMYNIWQYLFVSICTELTRNVNNPVARKYR